MKVFWLFNHPAPYKVDFFNVLGTQCELDVVFERAVEEKRNAIFYGEKAKNFHMEIARSFYLGGINNFTMLPLHYLKNKKYDTVVINGWRTFSEEIVIDYLRKKKIPYIFYINGGIANPSEAAWKKKRKTHYISGADAYLCPDESSANYLVYYGADKNKISYYPYSSVFEKELVPARVSQEEKEALRQKLGLKGKHIFVSSGQFIERKNFEELIALWPKMPKDCSLYITGEGPLKDKYLAMQKELGETNVFIQPYMPHQELFSLFRASDAFVLLSKEDIYGHVINEALSQALPVVAGENINAATHLINNGSNGFVVPLGQEETIRNALLSTLSPSFQDAALAVAKKNTIEVSAKAHMDFFVQYLRREK